MPVVEIRGVGMGMLQGFVDMEMAMGQFFALMVAVMLIVLVEVLVLERGMLVGMGMTLTEE